MMCRPGDHFIVPSLNTMSKLLRAAVVPSAWGDRFSRSFTDRYLPISAGARAPFIPLLAPATLRAGYTDSPIHMLMKLSRQIGLISSGNRGKKCVGVAWSQW